MTQEKDTLEQVLQDTPRTVIIQGEQVTVSEVTMKSLRAFVAACAPFLKEFDEAGRLADRVDKETGDVTPPEEFALFNVLADNTEAFIDAAVLVTNKPRGFYERLKPNEFFEVASLIIQVNGDFFVQSLAPVLAKVAKTLGSIGLTRSSS